MDYRGCLRCSERSWSREFWLLEPESIEAGCRGGMVASKKVAWKPGLVEHPALFVAQVTSGLAGNSSLPRKEGAEVSAKISFGGVDSKFASLCLSFSFFSLGLRDRVKSLLFIISKIRLFSVSRRNQESLIALIFYCHPNH